jgi:ATP-dependent Lhr-like helicase
MDAPAAARSAAYDTFHPRVRQWIHRQGWRRLHEAQEHAAPLILAAEHDVIVAAATAAGKTEAAWFPICSALLADTEARRDQAGVKALCIAPLKALINDQYGRLGELGETLGIPVHRWHGDVAASQKSALRRSPDGLLLTTPESLEALFVRSGTTVGALLGGLRYVVIDEFHSFLGTERGAQVQSLLHRVELVLRRRAPRIALSATLGDFTAAAEFLRPRHGTQVQVVHGGGDDRELRLQLRGYRTPDPGTPTARPDPDTTNDPKDAEDNSAADPAGELERHDKAAIADHLFTTLRGSDNLVFAGSRTAVEEYTDLLERRCAAHGVPRTFLPHHGNLSKDLRELAEDRLKDRATPVTAICTSTLEMGIDIGSVRSVAQIGAPPAVAALRQRLGRSGRQDGDPSILRLYVAEPTITDRTSADDGHTIPRIWALTSAYGRRLSSARVTTGTRRRAVSSRARRECALEPRPG